MGKLIAAILVVAVFLVSVLPFEELSTRVEATTFTGIPLMILAGSTGVAYVTKRLEAIVAGVVLSALWPVLVRMLESVLATL